MGLAAPIVVNALTKGELKRAGLSQPIAFFLVERLLAAVVEHRAELWSLREGIVRHFANLERAATPIATKQKTTSLPTWPRRLLANYPAA